MKEHLKIRLLIPILLIAVATAGLLFAAPTAKADSPTPNPQQCQFVKGDADQDGIADKVDPTPAGPDANGNGVPDLIEPCTEDPSKAEVSSSETICRPEDGDRDQDGLGDACDPAPDNADADADGFPDSAEVLIGTDPLSAASWPFDIDGNGKVDAADLSKFNGNLGKRSIDVGYNRQLDLNIDGRVDIPDLLMFRGVLGKSVGSSTQTLATGSYVASAAVYSKTCYSEYVGYSTARARLYRLWVQATINYSGGRVTWFKDPPFHGAQTYVAGYQFSGLTADAGWYNYPYEVQAYSKANFALKLLGVTWWQQTRWAVADAGHSNGVTFCGQWAW